MTGLIAEEKIREIQERADILEVVSSYVTLKRSGANYQGLCPFHAEKTPSFNVNPPRQIYHCFGCGVGGDAISFVQRIEGLGFPEAVRRLGERYGIEVEEERLSPAEERRREEAQLLHRINEVAAEFYHNHLMEDPAGAAARAYLKERGYGRETATRFRLGFAPEGWENLARHLSEKGFAAEAVRRLGLVRPGKEGRGDYDLFRKRLIFPILDERGQASAFGGRILDDGQPKYINSPESPVYHKSRVLYGLYQARQAMRQNGEAVVVEGYFDVLAMHRAGFENTVATCGTALTADHGRLLKRYAKRLVLLFDQDSAGLQATLRAMDVLFEAQLPAAVALLDPGEDPDSFLRRQGASVLRQRLDGATPLFQFFLEQTLAAHDESIEGRSRAVEAVLAKLRRLPGEIERSLYLRELAQRAGVEEQLLHRQLGGPRGSRQATATTSRAQRPRPQVSAPPKASGGGAALKAQEMILQLLLARPETRRPVAEEGIEFFFSDEELKGIAAEVIRRFPSGGEEISERALFEHLSEEQQGRLAGILIRDDDFIGESAEQILEDCRQAARRERLRKRRSELQNLIQEAEKSGDATGRDGYQREFQEIQRQLRSKNP